MKQLSVLVLLFCGLSASAQELHTFSNGEVADAEKINQNFDSLEASLPPSNCSKNQIIRWNGNAWECTQDLLANLNCKNGDYLQYISGALVCQCVAPGQPITDANFRDAISDWEVNGTSSVFGDITEWCTGDVTNMDYAFKFKETFNEDISRWDTSNVVSMVQMFLLASAFNQNISRWDTRKVENMKAMFDRASNFNQPIGNWDTRSLTITQQMFDQASSFNQPLNEWETRNITDMSYMFRGARAFNGDISNWDVSNAGDMGSMFFGAANFNQDISNWDTSAVRRMREMFAYAQSFNQDLSTWKKQLVSNCADFAIGATAWLEAYDGSIAGKTPPLSPDLIADGCGETD